MSSAAFSRVSVCKINPFNVGLRSFCEKKPSIVPILKEIRAKTGAGVMECKKVLEKNDMDVEKAIAELIKKARSSTGRGRATTAGWIGMAANDKKVTLCEILSETDFVSKNKQFRSLADQVAAAALQCESGNDPVFTLPSEVILKESIESGKPLTVQEKISEMVFSMGETMKLDRTEGMQLEDGIVGGYVHGGRIGVLVGLKGGSPSTSFAKEIAVHIAACAPKVISKEDIPANAEEPIKDSDILLNQDYIHDESITVEEALKKHGSPSVSMHIMRRA